MIHGERPQVDVLANVAQVFRKTKSNFLIDFIIMLDCSIFG